jgi:hypothetical protein
VLIFLLVIISCQARGNPIREQFLEKITGDEIRAELEIYQWKTITEQLECFGNHLIGSNQLCEQVPHALRSLEGFKQLFLIRYIGATLNHYTLFLSLVRREYVDARKSTIDPRVSILRPSIMKEITADTYTYKEFHDIALDLIGPVDSLIAVLRSTFTNSNESKEFRTFTAELRCQCLDIIKTTTRFSSRIDHDLKYLDVSRNMNESLRVWVLSALASVFLPLSIATGLLNMQTRFIDLKLLLYDFCGVVVLVGTIVVILFQGLHGYVFLK